MGFKKGSVTVSQIRERIKREKGEKKGVCGGGGGRGKACKGTIGK